MNQYGNGNQYGNQFGAGMGGAYYAAPKKVEMHQALTPEEELLLKNQNKNNISFKLDQMELLAGICTHKSNTTKMPDITLLGGTRVKCNICQEEWDLIDDPELFKSALAVVISGLQTMKTWWIDIPPETAREYFPIIPLLKKAPVGLQIAMQCWRQYEEARQVNTSNGVNSFGLWNNIMTGGFNPMMQQQQQMMYQQQMQQQQMQQQQMNGMGFNPMMQQDPNMGMGGFNPNMGGFNPMVQQTGGPTDFTPGAGGFAPGTTGAMTNMGGGYSPQTGNADPNTQTSITNSVQITKTIGNV